METLRSPSVMTLIKPSKKIRIRDAARAINSRLHAWSVTGNGGYSDAGRTKIAVPIQEF